LDLSGYNANFRFDDGIVCFLSMDIRGGVYLMIISLAFQVL